MIQAALQTHFNIYVQTKDNSILNFPPPRQYGILHLVKFTNDMSGDVHYCYPYKENIYERYSEFVIKYSATPDMYMGEVNLGLAGYWKYEIFEIGYFDSFSPVASVNNSPSTEFVTSLQGQVAGLVTKGKMFVDEKPGSEEVQYIQQAHSVVKLNIIIGGSGYSSPPTITISAGNITTATATCTIDGGGSVDTVTITDGGSGYNEIPVVIVTGGGTPTQMAVITAEIENENYIYTG